jgi:3D (Asp-Asp-Asp) domain-containing protein
VAALLCFTAGFATWKTLSLRAPRPAMHPPIAPRAEGRRLVPVNLDEADEIGRFRLTFYWIHQVDDDPGKGLPVFDSSCNVLTRASGTERKRMRLEGTARLSDGSVINIEGACRCSRFPCFKRVDEDRPYGLGVKGHSLQPYRSIAVDPRFIRIGTPVYLAELDGLRVPGDSGFVHDGCVLASDRGHGIRGNKIDFFVAERENYIEIPSEKLKRVNAYRNVERCLSWNTARIARQSRNQLAKN